MTGFIEAVDTVLKSQITKYLVLGDREHGEKSLKCLAAAVNSLLKNSWNFCRCA